MPLWWANVWKHNWSYIQEKVVSACGNQQIEFFKEYANILGKRKAPLKYVRTLSINVFSQAHAFCRLKEGFLSIWISLCLKAIKPFFLFWSCTLTGVASVLQAQNVRERKRNIPMCFKNVFSHKYTAACVCIKRSEFSFNAVNHCRLGGDII